MGPFLGAREVDLVVMIGCGGGDDQRGPQNAAI